MKDGKQGELRKRKVAGAASCLAKFMSHLLVKELNPTVFRPKKHINERLYLQAPFEAWSIQ